MDKWSQGQQTWLQCVYSCYVLILGSRNCDTIVGKSALTPFGCDHFIMMLVTASGSILLGKHSVFMDAQLQNF